MRARLFAASAVLGLLLASGTAALSAMPAAAQQGGIEVLDVNDDEYPTVEVTVAVPDGLPRLSKEPFSITEGDRPVQPYLGSSPEAEDPPPPEVVLAVDVSGSMTNSIDRARSAADAFVASLPEDSRVAVVTFGDRADVLVAPTGDLRSVRSKIADIDVAGPQVNTALFAGIRQAAELLSGERGNIVLLADGENSVDSVTKGEAISALQQHDASIWAVELPSAAQDHQTLVELAGERGRVLTAANAEALEGIYEGLAADLSRQYVLRYESQANGPTELTVALDVASLRTERTRQITIDGRARAATIEASRPSADDATTIVAVPVLGTTPAFVGGLAAVAIGTFTLLTTLLMPRPPRPGERLVVYQEHGERTGARLSAFARWTTDAADRRLQDRRLGPRLDHALERAGLNVRPGELVVTVISAMVVVSALGMLAGSPPAGMLLALAVPVGIKVWLGVRRDRRQNAFADQLVDVLLLLASSLRAGYALTQGIDAVCRDAEEPAASEFRRIIVENRLGRDLDEAMANCAVRMGNDDFGWVVQAISIHRDVGGDLAKVLDNIVATVRDRADVLRQVRTLSAEGRLSARVLTALPILVLVLLFLTNPAYLSGLTTSPLGIMLLGLAGLLMAVGILVTQRMAKIRY